jgi:protein gp37
MATTIEWTDETWNPTTGCDRISAGCDHCYALTLAKRLKAMGVARYQVDGDPRTSGPGFGVQCHPEALDIPRRWRSPRLVFVNSMSDLFHARVPTPFITQVFDVMADTPRHTYQLLTKRPRRAANIAGKLPWPANVWLGVSVESAEFTWRIDELRKTPAAVRFVSAEPLIGPLANLNLAGIDWLIAGGESGPAHRPVDADWVLNLRDQCAAAAVAFFFKQWGGHTPKAGGRELAGQLHDAMPSARPFNPRAFRDPAGGGDLDLPQLHHLSDCGDDVRLLEDGLEERVAL